MAPYHWRHIGTAPRDGTLVILGSNLSGDEPSIIAGWYEKGDQDRAWYDTNHTRSNPTHWMPLPPRRTTNDRR